MHDQRNLSTRIDQIKNLAKEYFFLSDKALIEKYNERLYLFTITDSKHKIHPHLNYNVYISRRALKHFVERRKIDLLKKHTDSEAFEIMYLALDNIYEAITNFDSCELISQRYVYVKEYPDFNKPQLRVVVDEFTNSLEICSIHFRTKK